MLVTGGGSSTPRRIAEAFHALGDRVHVCDRDAAAVEATARANPGLRGTVADVGDPAEVERVVAEALGWLGGVDVLVNAVGISGPRAAVEDVTYEQWDEVMRVDVGSFFAFAKLLAPGMKAQGDGCIVNFSSASSHLAPPFRAPYVAAKSAVEGLTRCLARELGPHGVRVNAILPGAIENERMQGIFERSAAAEGVTVEAFREGFLQYASLRRTIQMDELADLVLFLCSPSGSGITGQLLRLDGNLEWEAP